MTRAVRLTLEALAAVTFIALAILLAAIIRG
jgi:hypothetical protein